MYFFGKFFLSKKKDFFAKIKKMTVINTYNESHLHERLKKIYALEFNGLTEVKLDDTQWICDIICQDSTVIEIQTSNLSALREKVLYILESGRKVKIVHPVLEVKYIEKLSSDGSLINKKKSPKKATLFDSLRGMTKIAPLFLNENVSLEILYVEVTEVRRETKIPVQNASNSRRHLKEWISQGKRLEKIIRKEKYDSKKDWLSLLPQDLPPNFKACQLEKAMEKDYGKKNARWARLLIWLFEKMQLIQVLEKQGRSKIYGICY